MRNIVCMLKFRTGHQHRRREDCALPDRIPIGSLILRRNNSQSLSTVNQVPHHLPLRKGSRHICGFPSALRDSNTLPCF